jgi:hypothetical protein
MVVTKEFLAATNTRGNVDLLVLKYMAQRLRLTLCQLDQTLCTSSPRLHYVRERRERIHRIALYRYQELFLHSAFPFVGFVSRRHKGLSQWVIDEIQKVDTLLVEEILGNVGILSYSSLQLGNGDWYNLVIMQDVVAKAHIKQSGTHNYAAYHLATHYYEWIRLHNGLFLEGLDTTRMLLHKTRYYTFQEVQQRPFICEYTYGKEV